MPAPATPGATTPQPPASAGEPNKSPAPAPSATGKATRWQACHSRGDRQPRPQLPLPPQQPPATPVPAADGAASANPAAAPKPSGAFDPRKARCRTQNARLKIDLAKFPNGLPFSIEMNKQPYLHFVTGDGASLDNLFVPPGVQQFRVVLRTGGQEWDSNVAKDDFKAKKRVTLKIQLMKDGKVQPNITLPISRDAQLFLSLSNSLMDNLPF